MTQGRRRAGEKCVAFIGEILDAKVGKHIDGFNYGTLG